MLHRQALDYSTTDRYGQVCHRHPLGFNITDRPRQVRNRHALDIISQTSP